MKKKILIIGAGPAGLTCGYQISKNKKFQSTIVEISKNVGGMARSIKLFDRILRAETAAVLAISIINSYTE